MGGSSPVLFKVLHQHSAGWNQENHQNA